MLADRMREIAESYGANLTPELWAAIRALARRLDSSTVQDAVPAPPSHTPNLALDTQTWSTGDGGGGNSESGPLELLPERYEMVRLLGVGGMGKVWEVRDKRLKRLVAMKIANMELSARSTSRFLAEAQATSQLEHPGIVPVYDVGMLRGGRPYYTMRIVRGRTLTELIREVHEASTPDTWRPGASGITLRRLLVAFHSVCDALGFAHARGVVHRDLKPDNVMIGAFGETLVVDWGLAKVLGEVAEPSEAAEAISTRRASDDAALQTMAGDIAGTPAYMAPEQARGDLEQIGPAADVHALGATLYEILTGAPPFTGESRFEIVARVLNHMPVDPRAHIQRPVPEPLCRLALDALAKGLSKRPQDAGALAKRVGEWLDGARRRERASALVSRADEATVEAEALLGQAEAAEVRASEQLGALPAAAPVAEKHGAWEVEDQAAQLRLDAALREQQGLNLLHNALHQAPDLEAARSRLADYYRARHEAAVRSRERGLAVRLEVALREHDMGRHARYLAGTGSLSLATEPAGASVELFRFEPVHRRLVPQPLMRLGATPVREVSLPAGSFLAVLRAPGRAEVRLPIRIERDQHAENRPPGLHGTRPVVLPPVEAVRPDECVVPEGWFVSGGDAGAEFPVPMRRIWLDAFAICSVPTTNADYIEFLDALVAEGGEALALQYCPRASGAHDPVYGRRPDGRFTLQLDHEGDEWLPDHPVLLVSWDCARAYAEWRARRDGLAWRLPTSLEVEKAARGVDGRLFPFGDFLDPAWCCIRASHHGPAVASPVGAYPADVSPYGVRDLAGGASEWCLDPFARDGRPVVDDRPVPVTAEELEAATEFTVKGSHWYGGRRWARAASRAVGLRTMRAGTISFRLARSL